MAADRRGRFPQVEFVRGGTAGTDGLHRAETVEMPVPVADLDVDPPAWLPGGEQDGWVLAGAFPAHGR